MSSQIWLLPGSVSQGEPQLLLASPGHSARPAVRSGPDSYQITLLPWSPCIRNFVLTLYEWCLYFLQSFAIPQIKSYWSSKLNLGSHLVSDPCAGEADLDSESCQNHGSLCTNAKQKYGDRVMEEKERVALLFCQGKGGTQQDSVSSTVPPSLLSRERCVRQEYIIRIKAVVVVQSINHVLLLWQHGLQHSRFACPSPSLRACSNSRPSSWWCHPTISSSVIPFSSCPLSFLASESFLKSWLFTSGGQSIGASASASVLPMNIQDWFPLGFTGLISLQSKGLSRVFSNTTVQKNQFFDAQLT